MIDNLSRWLLLELLDGPATSDELAHEAEIDTRKISKHLSGLKQSGKVNVAVVITPEQGAGGKFYMWEITNIGRGAIRAAAIRDKA